MQGEKMKTSYKSIDCIIMDIAEALGRVSGEFIEEIANKVLTRKVKYVGNEEFEIIEEKP